MSGKRSLAGLVAACALAGAAATAGAAPQGTLRVSVASDGAQANDINGRFSGPSVSNNGARVAFDSIATNLVPDDTNRSSDVFVHDTDRGRTIRVSVRSDGRQARGSSQRPAVSANGRVVVFDSDAANLAGRDNNSVLDVFAHNVRTGETTLVSVGLDGRAGDASSFTPSVSANGRYVAFASDADNLVPNDQNGTRDVFVRDLRKGTTTLVNVSSVGIQDDRGAAPPSISADGQFVAFGSFGDNLVPDDTNDTFDVFERDLRRHVTTRVSVASDGTQGDAESFQATISAHGEVVAFASDADNLVADDTNGVRDAFVHVLATGATERVSVANDGSQADGQSVGPGIRGGTTTAPGISGDGRLVTFDSIATNLVAGDTNTCPPFFDETPGRCPDVFVRDRELGTTTRISVSSDGEQGDHASTDPAIDVAGTTVAFFSSAANLVPGDTNTCPVFPAPGTCPDIFVHAAS